MGASRPGTGLVLLLCGVLAVLGIGWTSAGPATGQVNPTQCALTVRAAQAVGPDRAVGTGPVGALVVGDSYTSTPRAANWVNGLAAGTGWSVFPLGTGGTGFTNPGPCANATYGARLAEALARRPDVLVVQGGVNDVSADEATERVAIADVLARSAAVPRVVVVGPTAAPARLERTALVDRILADEVARAGRQYVSTQTWRYTFRPDGIHLLPAGYQDFGARVAAAVRTRADMRWLLWNPSLTLQGLTPAGLTALAGSRLT